MDRLWGRIAELFRPERIAEWLAMRIPDLVGALLVLALFHLGWKLLDRLTKSRHGVPHSRQARPMSLRLLIDSIVRQTTVTVIFAAGRREVRGLRRALCTQSAFFGRNPPRAAGPAP